MERNDEGATPAMSFVGALLERVRPGDLGGIALVPGLLVVVYALPEPARRGLVFRFSEPSPVTAYTAHFVHFTPGHLLVNVVGYVLLAGVGYLVAVLADRRRLFVVTLAAVLFGFPVVLSALNLMLPIDAISYGFSGLNMALLGLLPLLLAEYVGRNLRPGVGVRHAPTLFFVASTLVALLTVPGAALRAAIAAFSGGVAVAYARSLQHARRATPGWGSPAEAPAPGWVDLFLVGLVVFVGFLFVGFPISPALENGVLNTYVHLLGFCLAFIAPYVALELGAFGVSTPVENDWPAGDRAAADVYDGWPDQVDSTAD